MMVSTIRFSTASLFALFLMTSGSSVARANDTSSSLEGSWIVTIKGGPGTPLLPDWYQALVTFDRSGGLVATITDPLLNTGHGAWARKEKQKFAITILLFQFSSQGQFLGTLKARATLEPNPREATFNSDDYQFEFFDADGNPTGFVGVGTAHGRRIKVEPLAGN